MENNNNGQLLTALLAGAAVGAAAAVLFAPKSGKKMRSTIRRSASKASNDLVSVTTALSKNARQNIEESNDSLGYLIGSAIAQTVMTIGEIVELAKIKLVELSENSSDSSTLQLPQSKKS
ncbi:YtxH-like protein [Flavobacteriaceae bacterium MAR_2009_75]|nr:YtxH-like protein [Flavobacteriaceae bacterium MAR_2009_75]